MNLASYRIPTDHSEHATAGGAAYQPQFIFEMLNSKHHIDRGGYVSILSEYRFERVLQGLNRPDHREELKLTRDLEYYRRKTAESQETIERLREENKRLTHEKESVYEKCLELKYMANELRESLLYSEQYCSKLRLTKKSLEESYDALRKRTSTVEYQMKAMKENRDLASKAEVKPDKQSLREVYDGVERFLRFRVEEFTMSLKAHRMSSSLETAIYNFLQELLHINYVSVTNFKRHSKSVYETDEDPSRDVSSRSPGDNPLVLVNMDRLRLDKSLGKLRDIKLLEEEQRWPQQNSFNTFTYNKPPREPLQQETEFRTNLSMLSATQIRDGASRSKSRRRKIFG